MRARAPVERNWCQVSYRSNRRPSQTLVGPPSLLAVVPRKAAENAWRNLEPIEVDVDSYGSRPNGGKCPLLSQRYSQRSPLVHGWTEPLRLLRPLSLIGASGWRMSSPDTMITLSSPRA